MPLWFNYAENLLPQGHRDTEKKRGVTRPLTKTNDAPGLTLLGEVARLSHVAYIANGNRASQAFMDHGPFQIYANSFV